MKIGIVYTGTTKELVEMVECELKKYFTDPEVSFKNYTAPDIIDDVKNRGYVSSRMREKMLEIFRRAADEQMDIVFNICSSLREVAEEARISLEEKGIPLVLFDERMIVNAVERFCRIGIAATLDSALAATGRCVERNAERSGKYVKILPIRVKDSYGLEQGELGERCVKSVKESGELPEAIILAQGSMACVEQKLEKEFGIPVVSGLHSGVEELWETYAGLKSE